MIILLGCVAQPYELLQQHKFQLNTCFGVLPHRQFSAGNVHQKDYQFTDVVWGTHHLVPHRTNHQ